MKNYRRGDVVLIESEYAVDSHVQTGTRPFLVVQNDVGNANSPTTIVVPLSGKMKRLDLPTHLPVVWDNLRPSVVECEQVRVVDVSPDWKYLTTLPKQIMDHVDKALMNAFFYKGEGEVQ